MYNWLWKVQNITKSQPISELENYNKTQSFHYPDATIITYHAMATWSLLTWLPNCCHYLIIFLYINRETTHQKKIACKLSQHARMKEPVTTRHTRNTQSAARHLSLILAQILINRANPTSPVVVKKCHSPYAWYCQCLADSTLKSRVCCWLSLSGVASRFINYENNKKYVHVINSNLLLTKTQTFCSQNRNKLSCIIIKKLIL